MERTSLITRLFVAPATAYSSLTLVDGLPDQTSLDSYFDEAPLVLEGADYREEIQDSDQGQVINHTVRARIQRDEDFYQTHANQLVLLYFGTANGEVHFLGSDSNPFLYLYSRDSGAGNADSRETQLTYSQTEAL